MKKILPLVAVLALFLMNCGGGADAGASENSATGGGVTVGAPAAIETKDPITAPNPPITTAVSGIGINAGYASDGDALVIPTGFIASQCRFTAALATMQGSAISAQASVDDNGKVICKEVTQERVEIPPVTKGCVVSFVVLCVK